MKEIQCGRNKLDCWYSCGASTRICLYHICIIVATTPSLWWRCSYDPAR